MKEKGNAAEAVEPEACRDPVPVSWAYLSVGVTTLLWATNAVAVKLLVREVPGFPAGLLRITMTAAALLSWQVVSGKSLFTRRPEVRHLLELGVGGIAPSFLLFTLALSYTSV